MKWQSSKDYMDLRPHRDQVLKLRQFAVATCANPQGAKPGQTQCPCRDQLSNRDALSIQIAQRLAAKMELSADATPTTSATAIAFIRDTVSAYRAPRG